MNVTVAVSSIVLGGTAGAFSRITGSVGQAVATLSFDSNFQMVGKHLHVFFVAPK